MVQGLREHLAWLTGAIKDIWINQFESTVSLRGKFDAELCEVLSWWAEIVAYDRKIGLQMPNDRIDITTLVTNGLHILPGQLNRKHHPNPLQNVKNPCGMGVTRVHHKEIQHNIK